MPRYHVVLGKTIEFTSVEEAQRDAEEAAWAAGKARRDAMKILISWDAKGFTRAWESTMAPIEAAGDVGEYDANVLAEKRAARAVVVN